MDYSQTIVQLNKFSPDRYNVLVPVTTMQVASNLQRITVSEVQLDIRQNQDNKGPSKDIYFERSSGAYAITKVGGMKLAAAANISIVDTTPERTEGCQRCIEMARATGKPRVCGNCGHVHDVAVTVTIRVPEPSGVFRLMKATKEIDCILEAAGMDGGMNSKRYQRFLPHRTAIAESKAFMRAIRAALGLAGTYQYDDLRKPFVVARVVPNLDAPEIKQALAGSYLQSMGMLFEMPDQPGAAALPAPAAAEAVPAFPDEQPGQLPWEEAPEEPPDTWSDNGDYNGWGDPPPPPPQRITCSRCRREITGGQSGKGRAWTPEDIAGYSQRTFGRVLCPECQNAEKGGQRR